MEDFFVLILTLIFIVASFFGQSRKRNRASEKKVPTSNPEEGFWSTFGLEEEKVYEEKPVPAATRFTPQAERGRVDRFHTAGNQMRRQFLPKEGDDAPISVSVFTKSKSPFPLKKAVIYSEVLNRKYF